MGIEAAFEVADVAVLLRVHLVVGKDKLHIVEHELHGGLLVLGGRFRWYRLSGRVECRRGRGRGRLVAIKLERAPGQTGGCESVPV